MCDIFVEYVKLAERQTGKKLKTVRSDNGKEFTNRWKNDFCKVRGIRHQLTVKYTRDQYGAAERANRTINENG